MIIIIVCAKAIWVCGIVLWVRMYFYSKLNEDEIDSGQEIDLTNILEKGEPLVSPCMFCFSLPSYNANVQTCFLVCIQTRKSSL